MFTQDDGVPPSGTGSTSGQESDQGRPSAGDDIDRERDTTSTSRGGLSEVMNIVYKVQYWCYRTSPSPLPPTPLPLSLSQTLRNLANTSGQTVRNLFDKLERRLKSTDEKALFYSGGAGGQQRPQRSKRRGQNRQTDSAREGVPPNI